MERDRPKRSRVPRKKDAERYPRSKRETLMKELDRERMLRISAEQRLHDMTIESDDCKVRLQALQEEFKKMEEMVRSMLQYKSKIDQLKQEKANLENNLQKYHTRVNNLEQENKRLLAEVQKMETQYARAMESSVVREDAHMSGNVTEAKQGNNRSDDTEKSKLLLERLKILEGENSALVLENEQQRQQYEKCLDEIANQVVQALLTQKSLREECMKLQQRVFDLECQNQQLNQMFQQRMRFASDSVLQSLANRKLRAKSASDNKPSNSNAGSFHSLPTQSQCNFDDSLGKPELSSPPPWLRDKLFPPCSPGGSDATQSPVASEHVMSPESLTIAQPNPMRTAEQRIANAAMELRGRIETEFPANNSSPKSKHVTRFLNELPASFEKPSASGHNVGKDQAPKKDNKIQNRAKTGPTPVYMAKESPQESIENSPSAVLCENNEALSGPAPHMDQSSQVYNDISPGQELLKLSDSFDEKFMINARDGLPRIQNRLFDDSDEDTDLEGPMYKDYSVGSSVSLNELLENELDSVATPNDDNFSFENLPIFRVEDSKLDYKSKLNMENSQVQARGVESSLPISPDEDITQIKSIAQEEKVKNAPALNNAVPLNNERIINLLQSSHLQRPNSLEILNHDLNKCGHQHESGSESEVDSPTPTNSLNTDAPVKSNHLQVSHQRPPLKQKVTNQHQAPVGLKLTNQATAQGHIISPDTPSPTYNTLTSTTDTLNSAAKCVNNFKGERVQLVSPGSEEFKNITKPKPPKPKPKPKVSPKAVTQRTGSGQKQGHSSDPRPNAVAQHTPCGAKESKVKGQNKGTVIEVKAEVHASGSDVGDGAGHRSGGNMRNSNHGADRKESSVPEAKEGCAHVNGIASNGSPDSVMHQSFSSSSSSDNGLCDIVKQGSKDDGYSTMSMSLSDVQPEGYDKHRQDGASGHPSGKHNRKGAKTANCREKSRNEIQEEPLQDARPCGEKTHMERRDSVDSTTSNESIENNSIGRVRDIRAFFEGQNGQGAPSGDQDCNQPPVKAKKRHKAKPKYSKEVAMESNIHSEKLCPKKAPPGRLRGSHILLGINSYYSITPSTGNLTSPDYLQREDYELHRAKCCGKDLSPPHIHMKQDPGQTNGHRLCNYSSDPCINSNKSVSNWGQGILRNHRNIQEDRMQRCLSDSCLYLHTNNVRLSSPSWFGCLRRFASSGKLTEKEQASMVPESLKAAPQPTQRKDPRFGMEVRELAEGAEARDGDHKSKLLVQRPEAVGSEKQPEACPAGEGGQTSNGTFDVRKFRVRHSSLDRNTCPWNADSDSSDDDTSVNFVEMWRNREGLSAVLPEWNPRNTAETLRNGGTPSPLAARKLDNGVNTEKWLLEFSKSDIERHCSPRPGRKCVTNGSLKRQLGLKDFHSNGVALQNGWAHDSETAKMWERERNMRGRKYVRQRSHDGQLENWDSASLRMNGDVPKKGAFKDLSPTEFVKQDKNISNRKVNEVYVDSEMMLDVEMRFKKDFYRLCQMDSGSSREGSQNREIPTKHQIIQQAKAGLLKSVAHETDHNCELFHREEENHVENGENSQEFDEITRQIADLSRTVDDLQRSLSSLNSIGTDGDDLDQPGNEASEVYPFVDDGYCEVGPSPEEHPAHVKSVTMAEGRCRGREDPESVIGSEVDLTDPKARANLLDSLVDISSDEEQEAQSQAPVDNHIICRLQARKHPNKGGAREVIRQSSIPPRRPLDYCSFFVRYGDEEKQALSLFQFLDEIPPPSAEFHEEVPRANRNPGKRDNSKVVPPGGHYTLEVGHSPTEDPEEPMCKFRCNPPKNRTVIALKEEERIAKNRFSNASIDSNASFESLSDSCCEEYSSSESNERHSS